VNARNNSARWLQGAPETIATSEVVWVSASITHAEVLLGATLPSTGVDRLWVTNNRTVWNEQERVSEERELVYEISWTSKLGAWRSSCVHSEG